MITRYPGSFATIGSRPWWSPRKPCTATMTGPSSGPYSHHAVSLPRTRARCSRTGIRARSTAYGEAIIPSILRRVTWALSEAADTVTGMEPSPVASWADTLAVFDLETTGIDIDTCRIVTAHVGVIGADGAVLEQRQWLVDPGVEIPTAATLIHGVTTERARLEGRPAAQAVAEIIDALRDAAGRGYPIVAYNAAYDLSVLHREAERYAHDAFRGPGFVIDPLVIDKAVDRFRRGKRTLTAACEHYGVELTAAHDAGADAIAAGRVAQAIARSFPEVAATTIAELHASQVDWSREQAESYQEWRRMNGEPEFTTSGAWPLR